MKISGEQPLSGRWTRAEHYVILAILHYTCGEMENGVLDQLDNIADVYSAVVEVVLNNDIQVSLAAKSPTQIKANGSVNILPV